MLGDKSKDLNENCTSRSKGFGRIRVLLYSIFTRVVWKLAGTGLSKLPFVMKLYGFIYNILLPKNNIREIKVQGQRMYVDLRDQGDVRRYLFSDGVYHPQMTKVFKELVTKDMTVIDIGSNIGYFTLIASEIVGDKGKVFAFEPEPHNFDLMMNNINLNNYKNIVPVQKAISDNNGVAKLFIDRISFGSHSLITWPGVNKYFGQDVIEVETQTLDDYFKDYKDKIDLIKIDVEGAEDKVVNGMNNIIRSNNDLIIIVEVLPSTFNRAGLSIEKFLQNIREYGFNLYRIDEKEKALLPMDEISNLGLNSPNILATKQIINCEYSD